MKQNAKKTVIDGIVFDSKQEADRYLYLLSRKQAGEIEWLEVHPQFVLQPSFRMENGEAVRAVTYTPDFRYIEGGDRVIVEDVKAHYVDKITGKRRPLISEDCQLKVKMLKYQYKMIEFRFTE